KMPIGRDRQDAYLPVWSATSASSAVLNSNQVLAVIGAEPDGFVLQVVRGADEPDGFAFCAHQNGMGNGVGTFPPDATQKRAVADSGRAKDNVLPVGQIVGHINAIEIFFATGL